MIKRTCFKLCDIISGCKLQTRTMTQSSARLLLKDKHPISTTRFSFSAAAQNEAANETTNFSLKHENMRLTSAEFLAKVKESVGASAGTEEFAIPRPAFDALATEYDTLLEEVANFKLPDIWRAHGYCRGKGDVHMLKATILSLSNVRQMAVYVENKLLLDKYTRALAEVENVRRRGQKQTEEAKVFAIQGFCKDLLEVADILDLAVNAVKKEELDNNVPLKNLFEGLEMTRTVLEKTFVKHGLRKISPEGEKFDPTLHEAVFQVPKDQTKVESGCIAQVVKIGYALQNRPIRAAKVGVVQ